jgi:hypothetical protein
MYKAKKKWVFKWSRKGLRPKGQSIAEQVVPFNDIERGKLIRTISEEISRLTSQAKGDKI